MLVVAEPLSISTFPSGDLLLTVSFAGLVRPRALAGIWTAPLLGAQLPKLKGETVAEAEAEAEVEAADDVNGEGKV